MNIQYSDLIARVIDSNYRPFFIFDSNTADADSEWSLELKKGMDVSHKHIHLVFRPAKSLWSLNSELHKGDQVISMKKIKEQMSHREMKALVMGITKRILEEPLFPCDLPRGRERWSWTLLGTTNMVWKYLVDPCLSRPIAWKNEEFELARKYNLWLTLSRFREGRLFELPMWCGQYDLIRFRYDEYYTNLISGNSFKIEKTLAPFTQHLQNLGMKDEEIVEEYLGWMRASRWNCHPQFFRAVAGDPIFLDHKSTEYSEIIKHYLQGQLLGRTLEKNHKEIIDELVVLGGTNCQNPYKSL